MGKGKWRLTVTGDFSSSHQLRNYGGKCENMHGHNFAVECCVEGDSLTHDTGILMDFKVLKAMLREVLAELDHRHLNDVAAFAEANPSSENLARHIYAGMAEKLAALPGRPARLAAVSVSEKESSKATYWED